MKPVLRRIKSYQQMSTSHSLGHEEVLRFKPRPLLDRNPQQIVGQIVALAHIGAVVDTASAGRPMVTKVRRGNEGSTGTGAEYANVGRGQSEPRCQQMFGSQLAGRR